MSERSDAFAFKLGAALALQGAERVRDGRPFAPSGLDQQRARAGDLKIGDEAAERREVARTGWHDDADSMSSSEATSAPCIGPAPP